MSIAATIAVLLLSIVALLALGAFVAWSTIYLCDKCGLSPYRELVLELIMAVGLGLLLIEQTGRLPAWAVPVAGVLLSPLGALILVAVFWLPVRAIWLILAWLGLFRRETQTASK
jgi:cobalamin synthase